MADKQYWMTNFYYGQELKSRYMNGALNSGFRPGVYNASIALYTVGGTSAGDSSVDAGLWLYIKKGTTFIFSNSYSLDSDSRVYRNFNEINGNYETLIKSVALDDYHVCLIKTGDDHTISQAAQTIFGTNSSPCPRFYIIASMVYDPDENNGTNMPVFEVALDNKKFVAGSPQEDDSKNYYFVMADDVDGSETNKHRIPDGSVSSWNTKDLNQYSYLFLGSVIDVSMEDNEDREGYLDSNGKWSSQVDLPSGDIQWLNNHVFTGRGLPDYRQSMLDVRDIESPDIILNKKLNEIYLDLRDIYSEDIYFNTSVSWKNVHEVGKETIGDALKNRNIMYKLDYEVFKDPEDSTYEYMTYKPDATDIIGKLNKNHMLFKPAGSGDEEFCMLCDIIFVSLRHEFSDADPESINKIFDNFEDYSGVSQKYTKEYYLHKRRPKVIPFQWVSSCAFNNLDPMMDIEKSSSENITNKYYGNSLMGTKIIPLDVCNANNQRLSNMISNRNIIPLIIDYMRQHEEESPYLNPEEATSLLPIVIGFRKFKVIRNPENGSDTKHEITSLIPVDTISRAPLKIGDGRNVAPGRIHPANIFSFLDFQFKTNQINNFKFVNDNTYTVLPVMN